MNKLSPSELTSLNSLELLMKLDELREELRAILAKLPELEHIAQTKKELLPSILADCILNFMEIGDKSHDAKIKALSSTIYQTCVKESTAAHYEANKLKLEYRGLLESFRVLASIAYVRNSELKLG